MSEQDGFQHVSTDPETGQTSILFVGPEGMARVDMYRGEPCACPCWGLLLPDGRLYGPALPSEVHQAVLARSGQLDWSSGNMSWLREHEVIRQLAPFSELPTEW